MKRGSDSSIKITSVLSSLPPAKRTANVEGEDTCKHRVLAQVAIKIETQNQTDPSVWMMTEPSTKGLQLKMGVRPDVAVYV